LSLEPPLASTAPLSPAELKLKLYVDLISATLRSIYLFIQAQVIKNIGVILEEAGTSWDYVMKTTVFLANMSDYTAMNSVYGAMLPSPKPARSAVQVGKLPGAFLVEIEAIAAVPDS
jgi:hypothetical protein